MKRLNFILLIAGLATMTYGFVYQALPTGTNIGDKAIDLAFTSPEGKTISLSSLKGQIVLIDFWASWCGPCRMEMPSIQNLYNQVDKEKIVFIMLSIDRQGDADKVKGYVKDQEFTFPVYMPASILPNQLQVGMIPTTFVIDSEGRIVTSERGAANYDTPEFKELLEKLAQPVQ